MVRERGWSDDVEMRKPDLKLLFLAVPLLLGAAPSRTQTYTAGQVINPDHVTENEENVYSYLQAGVDVIRANAVVTGHISDGTIVNADISSSAAIGFSKLASCSSAQLILGNGSGVPTCTTLGADATIDSSGNLTIANNSIDGTDIALGSDAQGDVMYYNGTDWVRLGAGTSGQLFQTAGAGANPAWATRPNIALGTFTRDQSTASGTQAVTGVGFQPRQVIFFCNEAGAARSGSGVDNGTTALSIYNNDAGTATQWGNSSTESIFASQGSGTTYSGHITTLGSDGFTITWTRAGTPTGTLTIHYYALR